VPRDAEANAVSMYVCGVTVYDYSHIGHARVYVAFDVLYRQLRHLGYDVTYVRNFTDVDDKIIKRAKENGETCESLVERFIRAFHEDIERLGCLPPTIEPRATEHMADIIRMTERLVEKGNAYRTDDGDVYFAVDSFPSYGALSGRKPEDNRAGGSERVAVDAKKRNPADFALWKASKPGEPTWESPWGAGRPGWHIECSAMIERCLGPSIDIHGGGMDLTFPHHENEFAQSTAACGCGRAHGDDDDADQENHPFVKYWVHNGFVKVDSEKMSKSLGNFFTIREVTELYHPFALRWMFLGTHYRAPINYTQKALEEASDRLYYLYQTLGDAVEARDACLTGDRSAEKTDANPNPEPNPNPKPPSGIAAEGNALAAETRRAVAAALFDDLNTPLVTASLSGVLKCLNDLVTTKKGKNAVGREVALRDLVSAVEDTLRQVGLPSDPETPRAILEQLRGLALKRAGLTLADVEQATVKREEARRAKDFAASDKIRDALAKKGVALMDGGAGTNWRPCPVETTGAGEGGASE
jgi:cysteinyl-tRNA synthetase